MSHNYANNDSNWSKCKLYFGFSWTLFFFLCLKISKSSIINCLVEFCCELQLVCEEHEWMQCQSVRRAHGLAVRGDCLRGISMTTSERRARDNEREQGKLLLLPAFACALLSLVSSVCARFHALWSSSLCLSLILLPSHLCSSPHHQSKNPIFPGIN